jgi:DNA mismatch repair ATPase MutS
MNPFAIYDEVKAEQADAIVLVRVGNFYEAYDDDVAYATSSSPAVLSTASGA